MAPAKRRKKMETTMRNTILTLLGASLMVASTVQIAAAAEHHRVHRAPVSEQFRNSNAYAAPGNVNIAPQPDYSRYSGGISAPAGH
jgi:hypothetical protein